jgi:hypothetical protein
MPQVSCRIRPLQVEKSQTSALVIFQQVRAEVRNGESLQRLRLQHRS